MLYSVAGDERLASELINQDSDMMFAGVVAGNNPGEIWVDQRENPTSALVWSAGLEGFQFIGKVDNDYFNRNVATFVESTIIPFLQDKGLGFFEFSADSVQWYSVLKDAFNDKELEESQQFVYQSDSKAMIAQVSFNEFPDPFRAVAVDQEILSSIHNNNNVKNADFLVNYLKQYWGSVEKFILKGYGYAAVVDEQIVSLAVSTSRYQSTHGIGVETLEPYRKKGLSSSLVQFLLRDLEKHDENAWWDCMEQNIASQKTAEKAGLQRKSEYTVFWFYF